MHPPVKENILVITPLQKEFDLFLKACARRGFHAEQDVLGRLSVMRLPGLGMTLARGGTGKAQFALQTQHLLDSAPGWKTVVCAGTAGALSDSLCAGDVVVATTTVEHDYKKMKGSAATEFNERPAPAFDGDPRAMAGLRRVSSSIQSFHVHFGTIASGDEDIVCADRKLSLRRQTNALAVAWEGAGVPIQQHSVYRNPRHHGYRRPPCSVGFCGACGIGHEQPGRSLHGVEKPKKKYGGIG